MHSIRNFCREDTGAVSRFLIQNEETLSRDALVFYSELYSEQNIREKWANDHVILVEETTILCGLGRAKSDGWITHCHVHKDHRMMGLGNVIMNNLEQWLIGLGITTIHLNSSPFALDFYKRRGYTQTEPMKMYQGIPLHPMGKILTNKQ
jgi:GNAT superfamily N-acetyltransferase